MYISFRFFIALVALPAVLTLTHDLWLWLFVEPQAQTLAISGILEENIGQNFPYRDRLEEISADPGKFRFHDLGYFWTVYGFGSFHLLHENITPEVWNVFFGAWLYQSAFLSFLILMVLIYGGLGMCWLFGLWPFRQAVGPRTTKRSVNLVYSGKPSDEDN